MVISFIGLKNREADPNLLGELSEEYPRAEWCHSGVGAFSEQVAIIGRKLGMRMIPFHIFNLNSKLNWDFEAEEEEGLLRRSKALIDNSDKVVILSNKKPIGKLLRTIKYARIEDKEIMTWEPIKIDKFIEIRNKWKFNKKQQKEKEQLIRELKEENENEDYEPSYRTKKGREDDLIISFIGSSSHKSNSIFDRGYLEDIAEEYPMAEWLYRGKARLDRQIKEVGLELGMLTTFLPHRNNLPITYNKYGKSEQRTAELIKKSDIIVAMCDVKLPGTIHRRRRSHKHYEAQKVEVEPIGELFYVIYHAENARKEVRIYKPRK